MNYRDMTNKQKRFERLKSAKEPARQDQLEQLYEDPKDKKEILEYIQRENENQQYILRKAQAACGIPADRLGLSLENSKGGRPFNIISEEAGPFPSFGFFQNPITPEEAFDMEAAKITLGNRGGSAIRGDFMSGFDDYVDVIELSENMIDDIVSIEKLRSHE